jgi:hypothetical protein
MRDSNDREPIDIATLTVSARNEDIPIPMDAIEELSLKAALSWAQANAGEFLESPALFGADVAKAYRAAFALLSGRVSLSPPEAASKTAR